MKFQNMFNPFCIVMMREGEAEKGRERQGEGEGEGEEEREEERVEGRKYSIKESSEYLRKAVIQLSSNSKVCQFHPTVHGK